MPLVTARYLARSLRELRGNGGTVLVGLYLEYYPHGWIFTKCLALECLLGHLAGSVGTQIPFDYYAGFGRINARV